MHKQETNTHTGVSGGKLGFHEETAVIHGRPAQGHEPPKPTAPCCRKRTAGAGFDAYDLAAALMLGTLLVLLGATFGAYAISNDEEVQQRYGELIVAYYQSGFADQALFHFKDLYLYGGLFDVVAVGLEKLWPLHTYAVRHVLSALTGVGGIVAVWATARAIAGTRAGLLAAAAIAVCGTWYGAMFNHTKDIPFAAAMMGATYCLLCIGRELPRPRWHLVASFGVLCGCALGIRVLGLFLLSYAGLVVLLHAPIGHGKTRREVLTFIIRSTVSLIPAVLIAYAIMVAAWPWAARAPLNPLRALFTFADLHYPIYTMLAGHVYRMNDVPRWYAPTYIAIKLTLPLLIGAGLALVFATLPRRIAGTTNHPHRKEIAFIAFAAFFPLICDVAVRGSDFTGMRHFLFLARRLRCWRERGWTARSCGLPLMAGWPCRPGSRWCSWHWAGTRPGSIACIRTNIFFTTRWSAALPAPHATTRPTTGSTSCPRPWPILNVIWTGPKARPDTRCETTVIW